MRKLAVLAAVGLAVPLAFAADWPQWMGPKRDNVLRETGLLDTFPEAGPKQLWSSPVAGGYAGPAVVGGKVYCSEYNSATNLGEGNFQRKEADGTETVFALDAKTGDRLWEHKYDVRYTISYPTGPRCTPVVDGGLVYFLGAEGHLIVCKAEKGEIVWQKDLKKLYNTKSALWGYAGHPLIDGDKLITLVGGEGSHLVAFDKTTGKELWKSQTSEEQGYCPPTIIEYAGVRQLLLPGPRALKALNPETGERLWSVPYNSDSGSIIMTPLVVGEYLFLAGYNNKNMLVKLSKDKPGAEVVAQDKLKNFMSPVNVQPIVHDGHIYGVDQDGTLMCVEIPSGKRLWSTPDTIIKGKPQGSGTTFLVKHEDRFFLFNELGELIIAKLDKTGYKEISRSKPLVAPTSTAFGRKVVWCMPAFADKKLFVRNDKEMVCVDLAK
ncbi:MAG: PQQ-binding-like beta-propeller repeat protein [Fimbriiglobus sp.]